MVPSSSTPNPYNVRTWSEMFADFMRFTDDQQSLAWSPMPPKESTPSDCRKGGSCGLDLSGDSKRSQWLYARDRMKKSGILAALPFYGEARPYWNGQKLTFPGIRLKCSNMLTFGGE